MEHIIPRVRGGPDVLDNVALACFRCNLSKAAAQVVRAADGDVKIALFNPRTNDWNAYFEFVLVPQEEVAFVEGKNAIGRVTALRLKMNAPRRGASAMEVVSCLRARSRIPVGLRQTLRQDHDQRSFATRVFSPTHRPDCRDDETLCAIALDHARHQSMPVRPVEGTVLADVPRP